MVVLLTTAFLLGVAPVALLVMGYLIERATRPRTGLRVAQPTRTQTAGDEWFYRPMRPGFGRHAPSDPPHGN